MTDSSSDQSSGTRARAPGRLALVQVFVNSLDIESRQDELADPEQLARWLGQRRLLDPGAELTPADHQRALVVREALRSLLLMNSGGPPDLTALATLNQTAERAQLAVCFDQRGLATLAPAASGLDQALGWLLAAIYTAMADGSWPRFKACREDRCHWAFYDSSKNRSGTWCSMAVCGNRAKARIFRQRRGASRPGGSA